MKTRAMVERWDDVVRVVYLALDLAPENRVAFVQRECSDDPELHREVNRLLHAMGAANRDFLTGEAASDAAPLLAWVASEGLPSGTRFGPYEVQGMLGRGGMASVYLATDHKHRRQVAVKVLHADIGVALGRDSFLREIAIAATLHHPHILPLHDSGSCDGLLYYVMPHVEGESLRQYLRLRSRLPVALAVRMAREVADALAYAHRRGVVHRDIKPENILLQDGHAIVADFGIAQALETATTAAGPPVAGIGTPAYMSPEQSASQGLVDGRADIYAVGCLLYEMLAGAPPFSGPSPQAIRAQHESAPIPSLRAAGYAVSRRLDEVVTRALQKAPSDRFESAIELVSALDEAVERGSMLRWKLAGGVMLLTLAGVIGRSVLIPRPVRLGHRTPVTLDPGLEIDPAISPDGSSVAYAAGRPFETGLFVRPIERRTGVALAPAAPGPQRFPHWSPDGSRILFRSKRGIEIVSAAGGASRLVVAERTALPSDTGRFDDGTSLLMPGSWAPDGRRFTFVRGDSLYVGDADTRAIRLVTYARQAHSLEWSPDGRWIAFVSGNRQSLDSDFRFGNVGKSHILIALADGGEPLLATAPGSADTDPAWLPDSRHLLFISDRDGGRDIYQVAVRTSTRGGAPKTPLRLTTGVNASAISLSADGGRLLYSVFTETSNVWRVPIPVDTPISVTAATPVTRGSQVIEGFDVSADARWLIFDSDRSGNPDLYRVPVDGGDVEQLTSSPASEFAPVWSPDGRQVAFHAFHDGARDVFVMSDRGSDVSQLTRGPDDSHSPVWLARGQGLLYPAIGKNGEEVRVLSKLGAGRWSGTRALLRVPIFQAALSPDGAALAFSSAHGIAVTDAGGAAWRSVVARGSLAAGVAPKNVAWSADSRDVYFLAVEGRDQATIWSVPRKGGVPRLLVRFDDPTRTWHRYGFRAAGGDFYFTIGDRQSDLWRMDVDAPRWLGR